MFVNQYRKVFARKCQHCGQVKQGRPIGAWVFRVCLKCDAGLLDGVR